MTALLTRLRQLDAEATPGPLSWRREHDSWELYLGSICAGSVADRGARGKGFCWICNFPQYSAYWRAEKSRAAAVDALLTALSDWLRDAGLLPHIIAALEKSDG